MSAPDSRLTGPLLVVCGPTATGKTRLVELLARTVRLEAVAADAMQVYKGMDIGTAKPAQRPVRYHCIDLVEPTERFSAARYQPCALTAIGESRSRGNLPVIVGGTGLYVRSVVDRFEFAPGDPGGDLRLELERRARSEGGETLYRELLDKDPEAAAKIPPENVRRVIRALEWVAAGERPSARHERFVDRAPVPGVWMVGLALERGELRDRIARRVNEMISAGLEDEVRTLWEAGRLGPTASQAIGYKELVEYFTGAVSWGDAVSRIVTRTRQYAKRQLTWFGRDDRLTWLDAKDLDAAAERVIAGLADRDWLP